MDEHNQRVIESMYLDKSTVSIHQSIRQSDEYEYVNGDGSLYVDEDDTQLKSFTISNILWDCTNRVCSFMTFKSK